jgi:ligand-binding SRPBCC domain-containing protein
VNASLEQVWQFHDTIETLFKLTPPHTKARLGNTPEPMRVGAVYVLQLRRMGIPLPAWHAEIIAYNPPHGFVDQQIQGKGPFAFWKHEHLFEAISSTRTLIRDRVTYSPPFGILGRIADALFLRRDIAALFAYRHKVTCAALGGKQSLEGLTFVGSKRLRLSQPLKGKRAD